MFFVKSFKEANNEFTGSQVNCCNCLGDNMAAVAGAQQNKADFKALNPDVLKKWGQAEMVVTAKLVQVIPGPVGFSSPPVWTFRLQLNVTKVLRGSSWPRGGSRIEFRFCLGEKSVTQSFYYFSRHHVALREKVLKK